MTAIEYSLILLSIIVGLVVFVFVGRWSILIKNSRDIKFSSVLVMWSVSLFIFLVFRWFWDFFYYIGSFSKPGIAILFLVRPIILYFCVDLLLPESVAKNQKEYFLDISRKFFILVTIFWAYEIFLWILFERNIFEPPRVLVLFNLCLSAVMIFVKKESLVIAFTVISLASVLSLFFGVFFS
jgi:hypothetical protein